MKTNFGFPWRWFLGQSSKVKFTSSLSLLSKTMFSYRINMKMSAMLFVIITFNLISSINAGPIYTRHRRMMREVYSELGMESYNNTQPDEGKCLLDGNQVLQATVVCNKKNGCRAIQKTGYCCPDYQCECERNGITYENGKKLVDPENPCKICYCKGGEISCNSVTCYERDDCVPKYIPGRCCPEYDNCPPLDELPSSTVSKSVTIINQQSTSTPKTIPEIQNNPLGIKIKEITKAEEIRIIDEKPKIYSTVKPNGSSGTNQSKVFQTDDKGKVTSSTTEFPEFSLSDVENSNVTNEKINSEIEKPSSILENVNALEIADINDTVNDENSSKIVRHTDQIAENPDDINYSTLNINLKMDLQKQGDKIVIVNGNGKTKPIVVHGVEGLQRGDDTGDEENTKEHNSDVTSENSKKDNPVNEVSEDDLEPVAAGSELDVQVSLAGPEASNKIVTEGVKSENRITTEGTIEDLKSSSTPGAIYETVLYTSGPEISEDKEITFETVYHEANESSDNISTKGPTSVTPAIVVDSDKQLHLHLNDDDTAQVDKSPEFPSIPDDLSIYNREVLTQAYTEDEPKNFPIRHSTEDPEVIELINPHNSSTESTVSKKHSDIKNEEAIDDESLLIPKWEKNSTELINNNGTDNSTEEEWNNQVNFEVDPGSGSGLGQIIELSSPRPKNTIDIDDAIEASADTPVILNNEDTADTVVESEPISHLFDPDSQTNHLKFLKAIDAFHNIRKSYLNFLNF